MGNLQECGDFTWRLSDSVKNYWELLTGDDGVDGGDFTLRAVNMNFIVEERTNKPSTLTACFTSL